MVDGDGVIHSRNFCSRGLVPWKRKSDRKSFRSGSSCDLTWRWQEPDDRRRLSNSRMTSASTLSDLLVGLARTGTSRCVRR